MEKTAVLVIGAGPVGLSTALKPGRGGQKVLVLEAGDGFVDHPRAGGPSIRTFSIRTRQVRACDARWGRS